jgi:hypothetical protein
MLPFPYIYSMLIWVIKSSLAKKSTHLVRSCGAEGGVKWSAAGSYNTVRLLYSRVFNLIQWSSKMLVDVMMALSPLRRLLLRKRERAVLLLAICIAHDSIEAALVKRATARSAQWAWSGPLLKHTHNILRALFCALKANLKICSSPLKTREHSFAW